MTEADVSLKRLAAVCGFLLLVGGAVVSVTLTIIGLFNDLRSEMRSGFHDNQLKLVEITQKVDTNTNLMGDTVRLSELRSWIRVLQAQNGEISIPDWSER